MVILTREQLEDRLAALHRASLELVSNLSLDSVLKRIVTLACDQANASYAALGVVDEKGELVRFIPVGMSDEAVRQQSSPPKGMGLLGILHKNRHTTRIADIRTDPRSVGFPPGHPYMQSFLGVPITLGDRLLGQIYLTDKQNYHEFTEQDERVIETLAAYAAVAITNARLYEDLLRRDQDLIRHNEDLALVNKAAAVLTESLSIDEILDKTLSLVMSYLGVEAGEIFLQEDGEKELRLALHRGDSTETFWTRDHFRLGEGWIGSVAQSGKPLVNNSNLREGRYLRRAIIDDGYRCMAVIPLTVRGAVIGVMAVATRCDRELVEREVELLASIGSWAGITIENSRLQRQEKRLAVLEERERIGMDLHDGIIQSIYGVGLALDYARLALEDDPRQARQKIEQSIDALNNTIRDIRAYILDLRPRAFHAEDIKQGLQQLIAEFQANSNITASLVGPENGLHEFPASQATALFHICQEALANIAKHSHAKHADVHLWMARDRVLMEISDNGQGFDVSKMSVTLGHGLSNMHIRARKVGGDVEITSYPGEGTTVLAWVPRRIA